MSHDRRKPVGKRTLTDEQVGWLRKNPESLTLVEMAAKLGISYNSAYNAARGVTHRRLNLRFPPRI